MGSIEGPYLTICFIILLFCVTIGIFFLGFEVNGYYIVFLFFSSSVILDILYIYLLNNL